MKAVALMLVLLACASAVPSFKRKLKDEAMEHGGKSSYNTMEHGGKSSNTVDEEPQTAGGEGEVQTEEGDDSDWYPRPISTSEFRQEMEELIGDVRGARQKLEATAWAVGALHDNPTEEAMASVVEKFKAHEEHNRHLFDIIAVRLVHIMFRLYVGGEGFADADRCAAVTGFFNKTLEDPSDPSQREDYMKAMAGYVWVDLWCFIELYREADTIDTELMESEEYTEAHAAHLVSAFLREVHLVRKNTQHFNMAVGQAYDQLGNDEEGGDAEEERQLKRLLKRLLADTKGIKK